MRITHHLFYGVYQYVVDLRAWSKSNLPEIQEVDTVAIAQRKTQLASQLVGGGPCVIADTALHFTAFGWYAWSIH